MYNVELSADGWRAQIITDPAAMASIGPQWDEVVDDSEEPVYFLRHHWNLLWWQQFAPSGSQLFIICCRDRSDRLVGIAPLYLRRHRMLGIPYARELVFIGTGIELKSSEYLDIIARRHHEYAVAQTIAAELKRSKAWDRIWLHQARNDSIVLPSLLFELDERAVTAQADTSAYVDTSIPWEAYKQELGKSMRRNVEYYARRLAKNHSCRFERVTTPEQLEEGMEAMIRLHQARWQAAGEAGSFSQPALRNLIVGAARKDLPAGRLRLWTLRVDGKIEGALLGFLDGGVLHYFQKGINPSFAREDLGTALLSLCIRDCFEDPEVRAFDFMSGGKSYKQLWGRHIRTTSVCDITRENFRTRMYSLRSALIETSTNVFRALAPTTLRAARRDFLHNMRRRRRMRSTQRAY